MARLPHLSHTPTATGSGDTKGAQCLAAVHQVCCQKQLLWLHRSRWPATLPTRCRPTSDWPCILPGGRQLPQWRTRLQKLNGPLMEAVTNNDKVCVSKLTQQSGIPNENALFRLFVKKETTASLCVIYTLNVRFWKPHWHIQFCIPSFLSLICNLTDGLVQCGPSKLDLANGRSWSESVWYTYVDILLIHEKLIERTVFIADVPNKTKAKLSCQCAHMQNQMRCATCTLMCVICIYIYIILFIYLFH